LLTRYCIKETKLLETFWKMHGTSFSYQPTYICNITYHGLFFALKIYRLL
jgi:hypothetical protein